MNSKSLRESECLVFRTYGNLPVQSLLLHTEAHGDVYAVWEDSNPESVNIMKEIMETRLTLSNGVKVQYHRVPITAEQVRLFGELTHKELL
jgi:hypothetical protein